MLYLTKIGGFAALEFADAKAKVEIRRRLGCRGDPLAREDVRRTPRKTLAKKTDVGGNALRAAFWLIVTSLTEGFRVICLRNASVLERCAVP